MWLYIIIASFSFKFISMLSCHNSYHMIFQVAWHCSKPGHQLLRDSSIYWWSPTVYNYQNSHIHIQYNPTSVNVNTVTPHTQLSLHHRQAACEWSRLASSHCSQPSHSSRGHRVWSASPCHRPQTPPADKESKRFRTKPGELQGVWGFCAHRGCSLWWQDQMWMIHKQMNKSLFFAFWL